MNIYQKNYPKMFSVLILPKKKKKDLLFTTSNLKPPT